MPRAFDLQPVLPRTRVGPFAVHGMSFVIESNEPTMAAELDGRLRDLRVAPTGDPPVVYAVDRHGPAWDSHPWGVWRDGEPCETSLIPSYVIAYVLWEVTRLLLENVAPNVPIHSGAVTLGEKAVVLAGRSHAGKSTLTAWLTTRGWGFLTDEVAIIDLGEPRPVVRPFWRPIGIRRDGPLEHVVPAGDTDNPALVPASTLGALAPATRLAAVVLPRYSPGHGHEPEPLTPAETLMGLTEHLPVLREQGRRSFLAMAAVAESVPGFALAVDDLDEAQGQLRAVLEDLP